MNKIVDFVTNDYYKILSIIYDNQITVDNETYCPLSQEKIASIAGVSRNTIGTIVKRLKEENLIYCKESETKKYFLYKEATDVIKKIKKI